MLTHAMSFLSDLTLNNDRTWFRAHQDDYLRAKAEVEDFVFGLFPRLGLERGSHPASFWFHRIYRDTRFSREKTPYKRNFSAVLGAEGKKGPAMGAYFHIEPGHESAIGGGLWAPEPAVLKKFRLDMEDGPRELERIVGAPEFRAHLTLMDGEKLKRVPKGFAPDHPAAEWLKLKQIIAWRTFTDDEVLAPGFADDVVATVLALQPFLRYMEVSCGLVASSD